MFIKKTAGLGASNHLSGIAIDVDTSPGKLKKINKFAATLVPKVGSGVKKVFPEPGQTHIEFTFKVC